MASEDKDKAKLTREVTKSNVSHYASLFLPASFAALTVRLSTSPFERGTEPKGKPGNTDSKTATLHLSIHEYHTITCVS